MPKSRQPLMGNYLLRTMPADSFAALYPHLKFLRLPTNTVLAGAGQAVQCHVFLEAGLASAVARSGDNQMVEAAHLGREAMIGHQGLLSVGTSPYEISMQIEGSGWQISGEALRRTIGGHHATMQLLLRFVHALELQIIHSVVANARYSVHQRLARWLLMTHDRLDRNDLPLTHELLATRLGVRRAGITDALHTIEGLGAIRATRGNVQVVSRATLETVAQGSYGVPEAEYERLIGVPLRRGQLAQVSADR
ncbi:Crp/Fnr family transcriptional regulator [Devosia sp. 1566]|uniref:Crp/Fnr family transcriptional regulator n=1 Tax=Devosia sp. 1566 TaxID=2499144 RepID=UPI0020BF1839|nr:Crp/Fnr family transcriptional regulator [Devosia sp. 1566]